MQKNLGNFQNPRLKVDREATFKLVILENWRQMLIHSEESLSQDIYLSTVLS